MCGCRMSRLSAAIDSLYAAGFEMDASIRMRYEQNPERYRLLRHAVPFHHTKLDVEFDLHWRLGGVSCSKPGYRLAFNSATVELTLDGWAKGIRAMSGCSSGSNDHGEWLYGWQLVICDVDF